MRVVFVCLLSGPVVNYQQELVEKVAAKFNLNLTKNRNLPTHFTLKYPFEVSSLDWLEKVLAHFATNHSPAAMQVGGFKSFGNRVIYLDVKQSQQSKKIASEFCSTLRQFPEITWKELETTEPKLHITIAENCNEQFQEVMNFLTPFEKKFKCKFNSVSLLRQVGKKNGVSQWKVHRTFIFSK
ncbi:MAG: 2'-5' RNA ligase family protein [Candidatus Micrarchaeota archaeon]